MSFTDGKPQTVTAVECKLAWYGGANGKYFRCGLCGHKFKEGDYYRFLFTNNIPGAGGNPLVCKDCDTPDVIEKWIQKCKEFNEEKYWFFKRGAE